MEHSNNDLVPKQVQVIQPEPTSVQPAVQDTKDSHAASRPTTVSVSVRHTVKSYCWVYH